jgi:hypothetical protein
MSQCSENAIGPRNYIRYSAASLRVQCIERVRLEEMGRHGAVVPFPPTCPWRIDIVASFERNVTMSY